MEFCKSSTLLNYINIDYKHISKIIDLTKLNITNMPKSNIKILPLSKMKLKNENIVLILVWNFKDEIMLF